VQVGDWTEGAACYEDEWLLGGVSQDPLQTMGWERIAIWVGELPCLGCHNLRGGGYEPRMAVKVGGEGRMKGEGERLAVK